MILTGIRQSGAGSARVSRAADGVAPLIVRTSVFRWVESAGVREEQMPAAIAAEGFQTEQGFVSLLAPKLARAFEAYLALPASGFHRPAAQRLAFLWGRAVVQPLALALQAGCLPLDLSPRRSFQSLAQLLQFEAAFATGGGFEMVQERLDPRARRRRVVRMERGGHAPQRLADVVEIHPLARARQAVAGQVPNPHRASGHEQDFGGPARPWRWAWDHSCSLSAATPPRVRA